MPRGLRVIAGAAGGLHLVAPRGARPTTDRVKESLFASLGESVVHANVLDLFAGSGALGIEALSRGAEHATFVDDDREAAEAIRRNLTHTGLAERGTIWRNRVDHAIAPSVRIGDMGGPFDLVFVDPPYESSDADVSRLLSVLHGGWLTPGATLVVERGRASEPSDLPPGWQVARERRYGDTLLLVLTVPTP